MAENDNLQLGKLGKQGQINLKNVKSGIKKEQIQDAKMQTIFDMADKDKNGILTDNEITAFQTNIEKAAKDDNLSKREAKKFLKSNGEKKLNENDLYEFLNKVKTISDQSNIQSAVVDGQGNESKVILKSSDGTTETIYNDKSSTVETNNENGKKLDAYTADKKLIKEEIKDKDGNFSCKEYDENGNPKSLTEINNDKTSKKTTKYGENGKPATITETNQDNNPVTVTTCDENGNPKSQTVKNGTTTEQYSINDGQKKLTSKVENEGIPAKEKRTNYAYNEDGTVTETITENGQTTTVHKNQQGEIINDKPSETEASDAVATPSTEEQQAAARAQEEARKKAAVQRQYNFYYDKGKAGRQVRTSYYKKGQKFTDRNGYSYVLVKNPPKSMKQINGRQVAVNKFGDFIVVSGGKNCKTQAEAQKANKAKENEAVVLKNEYVNATNAFANGQKIKSKFQGKDGKIHTGEEYVKISEPDKFGRTYVVDKAGEVKVMSKDGFILKTDYIKKTEYVDNIRTNSKTASSATVNIMKNQLTTAKKSFDKQMKKDGWAADTADFLSGIWGSKNRASKVREDFKTYEKNINELEQAAKQGDKQFGATFKKIYGVNYNANAIADWVNNPTDANYKKAFGTKNNIVQRVAKYNQSQDQGAEVVKVGAEVGTTLIVGAATGGVGLVASGALMAGTTAVVETTDRMSSKQGIQNGELADIAEKSAINGAMVFGGGVIAKGAGVAFQGVSKTAIAGRATINAAGNVAMGAAVEYEQTGQVSLEGVAMNAAMGVAGGAAELGAAKRAGKAVSAEVPKTEAQVSSSAEKATGSVVENREIAGQVDIQHVNASQRKVVEDALNDAPTAKQQAKYNEEVAYQKPTAEERQVIDKNNAKASEVNHKQHEIGNNIPDDQKAALEKAKSNMKEPDATANGIYSNEIGIFTVKEGKVTAIRTTDGRVISDEIKIAKFLNKNNIEIDNLKRIKQTPKEDHIAYSKPEEKPTYIQDEADAHHLNQVNPGQEGQEKIYVAKPEEFAKAKPAEIKPEETPAAKVENKPAEIKSEEASPVKAENKPAEIKPEAKAAEVREPAVIKEEIANDVKGVEEAKIPAQNKQLWNSCKERIEKISNELASAVTINKTEMLEKCRALFQDLKTVAATVEDKIKVQIQNIMKNLRSMLEAKSVIPKNDTPMQFKKIVVGNNENTSLELGVNGYKLNIKANKEIQARIRNLKEGEQFTVGRDGDVILQDADRTVSRQHLLITKQNGNVVIQDVSKNGSKVLPEKTLHVENNENIELGVNGYKLNIAENKEIQARIRNLKEGEQFTVGRDGDVILQDADRSVSRQHLLITKQNGRVVIKDISRNGSKVLPDKPIKASEVSAKNKNIANDDFSNIKPRKGLYKYKASSHFMEKVPVTEKTQEQLREYYKKYFEIEKLNVIKYFKANGQSYTMEQVENIARRNFTINDAEHFAYIQSRPDLFGPKMQDTGCWTEFMPKDQHHGAWKMHLFSANEIDWRKMSECIIPYLKEHNIEWKTFNVRDNATVLNGSIQQGKAFTVYPKNNQDMAQIAKDLDYIIHNNHLEMSNSSIIGDRAMGDNGRLFYRYEFKSKQFKDDIYDLSSAKDYNKYLSQYDSNSRRYHEHGMGRYLADDMTEADDPWLNFNPSNNKELTPEVVVVNQDSYSVKPTKINSDGSVKVEVLPNNQNNYVPDEDVKVVTDSQNSKPIAEPVLVEDINRAPENTGEIVESVEEIPEIPEGEELQDVGQYNHTNDNLTHINEEFGNHADDLQNHDPFYDYQDGNDGLV